MFPEQTSRIVRTQSRHRLGTCLLLGLLCCADARAACLESPDPEIHRLQTLAEGDAREALRQSGRELDTALQPEHPDSQRVAALYAVQADSYDILELDAEARAAAARGLQWTQSVWDATRLNLLMSGAQNAYDQPALDRAIAEIEDARDHVPAGSLGDTCLLITLGRAQYRADRVDLAVRSLTLAYAHAVQAHAARQRVLAAEALVPVMRAAGDDAQAQSLIQEVLDWDRAQDLPLSLSVAHYEMAGVLADLGRYEAAVDELAQSRALSLRLGDDQGAAFADMRMCEAEAELKRHESARAHCRAALEAFQAHESIDNLHKVATILARLDLEEGRTGAALATLNQVLQNSGKDLPPLLVADAYGLRARAEASAGQYQAATRDFSTYIERFQAANAADRVRQETALRARFDMDREAERNESLRRQLALERERTDHQRSQLRWTMTLGAAGLIVILLLAYIVVSGQRNRRRLQQLASEDALTGLPNRRQTTQLAEAALALASRQSRVITLAMIDLDHFKQINDRCGHVVGDHVLQEFASRARSLLRAGDIFGRWGGEEFLLIMPDCSLDQGLGMLERLRTAAAGIALPPAAASRSVTLSAGLTTNEDATRSLDVLVARADSALYEAKHGGRDLVRIAEEDYRTASTGVRRAMGRC